ncbi:MAG: hypothetical protein Q8O05_07180 [Chloroflexota bacterium]|nr:hypothetical protein [Chloroflexota bacterium]
MVIILTYAHVADDDARHFVPRLVYVDGRNKITETKQAIENLSF